MALSNLRMACVLEGASSKVFCFAFREESRYIVQAFPRKDRDGSRVRAREMLSGKISSMNDKGSNQRVPMAFDRVGLHERP